MISPIIHTISIDNERAVGLEDAENHILELKSP